MHFSIAQVIRSQAKLRPDLPALSMGNETQTYAQLDARSSRLANALLLSGVIAGDRVAILSKNTPEFFELLFACGKIGCINVGLNWRLAPPEITSILKDASPKVVIVSESEGSLLEPCAFNLPSIERVIQLGDEFNNWRDAASDVDPNHPTQPNEVILLLYTSGTTGLPKGVMLTNSSMSLGPDIASKIWKISENSVNLVAMPLFHIGGIGYGLSGFFHGAHSILMREVNVAEILETIGDRGVTHSFFVPSVIHMLISAPTATTSDFSTLELVTYGASPVSETLLKQAIDIFGCDFTQAYGMTETSGTVIGLPPKDHHVEGSKSRLLRSCGRPFPWVQLRLVDPTKMSDVAVGEVGEIWLKTEQNMAGYWRQPEATAQAINADGWLRTGDAAYCDNEGYLFLFDRFKDMIVSGGENIYPAEVENIIVKNKAVSEVAVIGVPSERWGETVKAIVVLKQGEIITESQLIEFTRQSLARYKCPTSVDFATTLPRNASGKLLKKDLRKAYWNDKDRSVN